MHECCGEQPVYEELFDLQTDPGESTNLIEQPVHAAMLQKLRQECQQQVKLARGL